MKVLIVGGGIGGLTLALALHRAGIATKVFESAAEIRPLGVGVNLLPHSTKILASLGILDALADVAVTTKESVFFNRFGQRIFSEPMGRFAGYQEPQLSIHRGDLQMALLHALKARIGAENVVTNARGVGFDQDEHGVTVHFVDASGQARADERGDVVVSAEGIHSAIRKRFFPDEGPPRYSGVNMWRGVSVWSPILTGASLIRAGWLTNGKMVIYPIRDNVDGKGRQLVNWVAELETPIHAERDWNRKASVDDFIGAFKDWKFDWLDVPALIRGADSVLEFPMVDQDPLPWWTQGRVTLMGDAAHPMYPRGSNGAGQAILDAASLAHHLTVASDPLSALKAYQAERLPKTTEVVLANRSNPPDAINREIWQRTGDKPFAQIEDVISLEELTALSDGYKKIAGYDKTSLAT
ncbi:flavin-dependent oxidoreductase [Bradyrhizobium sp. 1(2017)]|uniref:flavin-dependent oxidoreductase n=1 Tax=Bradyrhizobium sp. 1(2017) TaxID=1404888 RepID=UPI00140EFBD5|nr:flavin-dependent oxidoreductase [Bradyrhizobium sp. 1(2017)]QIO36919.1 flavin-dependent oxidoreductase [Bradyrhizobium sp. 1(2017)]